ncbi:MAG: glycine dehydrogenase [Psychroserpens sp.]|nr:glycine dehydrogenase [Psychroserpens sp.]
MSKKIIMRCDEANHVCDKAQYKECTFWEKIKLNIHLIFCRACRKYTEKNSKLTKLISKNPIKMDASAKAELKTAFEKELSKHQ